jgi:hypothetical protein
MRRKALLGILVFCIVTLGLFSAGTVSADQITKSGEVLYDGDYDYVWLWGLSKDEKITVDVSVVSPAGAKIDVYILSQTEFNSYQSGESFTPKVTHEDISSASFKFKSPDSQVYYLVIDNMDNARSTDAVPTGEVTLDYEYTDPLTAAIEAFEEAGETAFMICIMGIVIIVVVIIVIVVVVIKVAGKGKQPPAQPQQPYPQQPYQQPPPGGYPQQPYDQPPPQQPGDQPPQQPVEQPPDQQAYYPPQGQPPNQGQQPPPEEQQ